MQLQFNVSEVKKGLMPEGIMGVYFFCNINNEILYIGKSIDVKKRMKQHLYKGRKRLLHFFNHIKIHPFESELEALLYESQQIKKYRPIFNRKLRKTKSSVFLHSSTNDFGYSYFYLNSAEEGALLSFSSKHKACQSLRYYSQRFHLCDRLNGLEKTQRACFKYQLKGCFGACIHQEAVSTYNQRFEQAISDLHRLPVHCRLEFKGANRITFVEIENHRVVSYGIEAESSHLVAYPSNDEIRIVQAYAKKHPYQLIQTIT